MAQDQTSVSRAVIDRFYVAYLGGDLDGLLVEFAENAVVTFAGHGVFHGKRLRSARIWNGAQGSCQSCASTCSTRSSTASGPQ